MSGHKFKIGQLVNYLSRERASGVYQITQLLPPEGGAFQYRIKNTNEPTAQPKPSARTWKLGTSASTAAQSNVFMKPMNIRCGNATRRPGENSGSFLAV